MSKRRSRKSAKQTPLKYAADGTPLCRWCNKKVQPPRKTYCGAACVHEWKVRSSPVYMRNCVKKRDDGVCVTCGLDTVVFGHLVAMWKRLDKRSCDAWLKSHGIPLKRKTFWDCHHVIPVVEGGGECGLENVATLCVFCHQVETDKLRKLRNGRRKG